jgi:alpha-1,6-mannosyltransferase
MTSAVEPRAAPRTRYVVPLVLALLGLAICAALWWIGPSEPDQFAPAFLPAYTAAWVLYVAAGVVAKRMAASGSRGAMASASEGLPQASEGAPAPGRHSRFPIFDSQEAVLVVIIAGALLMRLVAYAHAPPLSTDSYRYLWDGRVMNAGINPYRYPPNAREVRFLRDANWEPIAYKGVATVYPPAAELLFAGLARLRSSDRALFFRCFLLADMGTVLLLVALLRRTGRPPERVIWYAWSPLVITEIAAGGHVDAVGLPFLVLALLLIARPARTGSAFVYAVSVLAKGPSAVTLPLFVRRGGWRFVAIFAAVAAVSVAPFAGAGASMFSGIHAYLTRWDTNASIFRFLSWGLQTTNPLGLPPYANGLPNYIPFVRPVMTLLTVAFVTVLAWRGKATMEWLLAAVFATLAVQVLLGAPVLPWYVVWTVPALCWWNVPGWLLFTLTVSLGYYARWLPLNISHDQWLWAEYGPVYGLLVGQGIAKAKVKRKKAKERTERQGCNGKWAD